MLKLCQARPQTISPGETPYKTRRSERPKLTPNPRARLRDQVHEVMRFLHFSERTEETYWQWIARHLRFHRNHSQLTPGGAKPVCGRFGLHYVAPTARPNFISEPV